MNTKVVGISADSPYCHKKYAESLNVNFPLLSDRWAEVGTAYGIWNPELRCEHRAITVIDGDRFVRFSKLYRDADYPSIDEVFDELRDLEKGKRAA